MSKWRVRKLMVFIVQVERLVLNLKPLTRNNMKSSKVFIITFLSAAVNLEIGKKYRAFAHSLHMSTCNAVRAKRIYRSSCNFE